MSLGQTLSEIEPIFRETDSTFQFTYPSFQEILAAKQFADEINFGSLSVEDAYINFWSYKEDAELWGLPKDRGWRALLLGWKNIINLLSSELNPERFNQLILQLVTKYFKAVPILEVYKKNRNNSNKFWGTIKRKSYSYNPFLDDFFSAADLASKHRDLLDSSTRDSIKRELRRLSCFRDPPQDEIYDSISLFFPIIKRAYGIYISLIKTEQIMTYLEMACEKEMGSLPMAAIQYIPYDMLVRWPCNLKDIFKVEDNDYRFDSVDTMFLEDNSKYSEIIKLSRNPNLREVIIALRPNIMYGKDSIYTEDFDESPTRTYNISSEVYRIIRNAHNRIKPQGYNSPVKN